MVQTLPLHRIPEFSVLFGVTAKMTFFKRKYDTFSKHFNTFSHLFYNEMFSNDAKMCSLKTVIWP